MQPARLKLRIASSRNLTCVCTVAGAPEVAQDVRIDCNSNEIWVAVKTQSGAFNGMIYPKGLSKNSSCMSEFVHQRSPVRYRLPLRSCNTMSTDLVSFLSSNNLLSNRRDQVVLKIRVRCVMLSSTSHTNLILICVTTITCSCIFYAHLRQNSYLGSD